MPVGDRRSTVILRGWCTAERATNKWQRTPFAAGDFGGKCEREDSPFHLRGAARTAGRRISAGAPTGSVARRHGNADLRSAQPRGSAAGETDLKQRHGPYSNGYFNRSGGRCGTSRQSAVRGSPACGGRCRPEVGVPSRPRDSARVAMRRSQGFAQRCRSETGAPRRPRDSARVAMRGFAAVRLAGRRVVGAGFALPRDRGRRCWGGFRAPARCRSEAPTGRTGRRSMCQRFCAGGDAWVRSGEIGGG